MCVRAPLCPGGGGLLLFEDGLSFHLRRAEVKSGSENLNRSFMMSDGQPFVASKEAHTCSRQRSCVSDFKQ
jgi:hypothetical protein